MQKDEKCCPVDATASSAPYAATGVHRTIGGLPCYVAGKLGPRVVLAVPDIFGLAAPASLRFFDELAAACALPVVAVDYFRGAPWKAEDFPPKPGQNVGEWIGKTVPSAAVRRDTEAVLAALRHEVR
jgi:dienelactone hydrolase